MAEQELYLFDDSTARDWQPFALTRPVGELLLGAHTFRARAERLFGMRCAGHISASHLIGFEEPGSAAVVDAGVIGTTAGRLFLSSRAVLEWDRVIELPADAALLRAGGHVIGRWTPAGLAVPTSEWFAVPHDDGTPVIDVSGRVLQHVWDLVAVNPAQIRLDFDAHGTRDLHVGPPPCAAIGYTDGLLRLGNGVTIEPNVLFDFSHGPIWLEEGVTVRAFTRLAGPAYVGPGCTLLGGPYDAISIGPGCRVHGEVEESVILGYANKAHDGFLGHAYLGRWVNLGALTTNSDLKNNYGRIRMWTPVGDTDTGLIKLGCLLGDHVKTGIGALINTGTVIGAGSNLYGTEMPPKYVQPFSWGSGSDLVAFDVDKFIAVATTVMGRRKVELTDGMRDVLRRSWQLSRGSAAARAELA
jgi:UDP-N-acetylglucosamine diphosphorylase / glucose-1-phosphate thymidylyltransferase / UDP-N-acetylgalactosamine diphosphorylase / glucosamine-1-phosphate N-acetyltransferase / galactosamine-1-phosphate N-acetyltransferase